MRDASHLFGDPRIPARVWKWIEVQPCGCWHWTGSTNDRGYAKMAPLREGPAQGQQRVVRALRLALVGPIPPDRPTLDHECHDPDLCKLGNECPHRRCVNPLDAVPATQGANTLRGNTLQRANAAKTECDYGHPFDEENTLHDETVHGTPRRTCKTCARAFKRAYKLRKRGLPVPPITELMYPRRRGGRPRKIRG